MAQRKTVRNAKTKIIVTGGAGFIGSHLADALIKLGNEVHIIDDLSTGERKFINKKAVFHKADVRNLKAIKRLFIDFSTLA